MDSRFGAQVLRMLACSAMMMGYSMCNSTDCLTPIMLERAMLEGGREQEQAPGTVRLTRRERRQWDLLVRMLQA